MKYENRFTPNHVVESHPPPVQLSLVGGTLANLEIVPGFYRSSLSSIDIRECFYKEACQGGNTLADYCATGYTGPCESVILKCDVRLISLCTLTGATIEVGLFV